MRAIYEFFQTQNYILANISELILLTKFCWRLSFLSFWFANRHKRRAAGNLTLQKKLWVGRCKELFDVFILFRMLFLVCWKIYSQRDFCRWLKMCHIWRTIIYCYIYITVLMNHWKFISVMSMCFNSCFMFCWK